MRLLKVRRFWPYLFVCGALSWLAFYWEGLHPAFALIPIIPFLPHEPRRVDIVFADPPDDDQVHHAEHAWHVIVQAVLFLFGLVNAGVILKDYDIGSWAMLLAELVGRPAGILIAVGLAIGAGLHFPGRMGWRELAGRGVRNIGRFCDRVVPRDGRPGHGAGALRGQTRRAWFGGGRAHRVRCRLVSQGRQACAPALRKWG